MQRIITTIGLALAFVIFGLSADAKLREGQIIEEALGPIGQFETPTAETHRAKFIRLVNEGNQLHPRFSDVRSAINREIDIFPGLQFRSDAVRNLRRMELNQTKMERFSARLSEIAKEIRTLVPKLDTRIVGAFSVYSNRNILLADLMEKQSVEAGRKIIELKRRLQTRFKK